MFILFVHDDDEETTQTTPHDLFGPIAFISINMMKYCLVILDNYSRYT
jgi:hypothetical protein